MLRDYCNVGTRIIMNEILARKFLNLCQMTHKVWRRNKIYISQIAITTQWLRPEKSFEMIIATLYADYLANCHASLYGWNPSSSSSSSSLHHHFFISYSVTAIKIGNVHSPWLHHPRPIKIVCVRLSAMIHSDHFLSCTLSLLLLFCLAYFYLLTIRYQVHMLRNGYGSTHI